MASTEQGATNFLGPRSQFSPANELPRPSSAVGEYWYFSVLTRDSRGSTLALESAHLTLPQSAGDITPPTFPGVGSVTPSGLFQLILGWTAAVDDQTPTSLILYRIQWWIGSKPLTPNETYVRGATSYSLGGLTSGTTYTVCVTAYDAASNATGANITANGTTNSDVNPPTFDGLGSAAQAGDLQTLLAWNPATDDSGSITSYKVYRATTSGGENYGAPVATVAGADGFYVDTVPSLGTYYYVVRAVDPTGNTDTNTNESSVDLVPASGSTSPTVGNFSPAPGTPITAFDALSFDVTDTISFLDIVVLVLFADSPLYEVVYDGTVFAPRYIAQSSVVGISGGSHFSIVRANGWPSSPIVKVHAIDVSGTEAPFS